MTEVTKAMEEPSFSDQRTKCGLQGQTDMDQSPVPRPDNFGQLPGPASQFPHLCNGNSDSCAAL